MTGSDAVVSAGAGPLVRLAALPGLLLGLLGSTGCDDHQAVEVRLEASGRSLSGPGVVYRRDGTRWVEADLRSTSGATAMLRLRQRPAWASVILRTPDGDRLTPEGAVELVGPADPKAGDTWQVARPGLQVQVQFVGDAPPTDRPRPAPPSNPWVPPPSEDPPTSYDDGYDGSGCGGDPVDEPEPPSGYDDGYEGSGCGGDPVDEPTPGNDNERWVDEYEGSGCGGDPIDGESSSDTDAGCDDFEGDEVDARRAARSFRTFWPIAVVVGFNRSQRRRSPGRPDR